MNQVESWQAKHRLAVEWQFKEVLEKLDRLESGKSEAEERKQSREALVQRYVVEGQRIEAQDLNAEWRQP